MSSHPTRRARVAPGASLSILLIAAGAGGLGSSPCPAAADEPINWRDDYFTAHDEAKAVNRLLWVQFTGPWCPHCTRMEQDSFPHPTIIGHARSSFVPVKLRTDVHEQLAQSFNVRALPATIIVAPNRDILATHEGYLDPLELDALLRQALARHAATAPSDTQSAPAPAAAASGTAAPPAVHPKGAAQPALAGYCPVSLVADRKLVRGKPECAVTHEGRVYHLASTAMLDRFRQQPDRYAPANEGFCPVAKLEHRRTDLGDPRWGVLYQNHLFLCASDENRRLFAQEPDRYAMADVAWGGLCLHCMRDSGQQVPGDPRQEVIRNGQRYWFPDATHREAFLASAK